MSAEDASVYFMKNQKPNFTVDDSTTKTLRSRANFLFKSEFNNGGMIKNISTLKAYPRRLDTLVEVKLHLETDSGMFKVIVMESRKVFKELLQCLV